MRWLEAPIADSSSCYNYEHDPVDWVMTVAQKQKDNDFTEVASLANYSRVSSPRTPQVKPNLRISYLTAYPIVHAGYSLYYALLTIHCTHHVVIVHVSRF